MKLFTNNIYKHLLLILCLTQINSVINIKTFKKKEGPKTTPDPPANPSDAVLKRITDYVHSLAEERMKSSDIMGKKKIAGSLPEGFPKETIQKALNTRNDKKKWRQILGLPTEIYRICLYPSAKINYVKWCNNSFFGAKTKGETCLYTFCEVCCDHLQFIYQNAAEKNILGELLQLNQEQGIKAIKDIINVNQIKQCKSSCKRQYPIEMPEAKQKPPRDPELGSEKKPATSCMDIKKWGAKTVKSGVFWIELPSKGPQKVFCDMETDNGGWTLFFNYVHQPGQELLLNENKLPENLKTNSHMYLDNAGFSARDVKEIRFLCTERFKTNFKFWHFKSNNHDFIHVAFKGDQSLLKPNSLGTGYTEIRPPAAILSKYQNAVDKASVGGYDIVGNSPTGGFSATIFGSSKFETNWTVKGDNPSQDIFECGSSHKINGNVASEDNPSMVFTHHSVWFRGSPLTSEEARERYMANIAKAK